MKHNDIFITKEVSEKKRFAYLNPESNLFDKIIRDNLITLPISREDEVHIETESLHLLIKEEYSEEEVERILTAGLKVRMRASTFVELESDQGKSNPCMVSMDEGLSQYKQIHFIVK